MGPQTFARRALLSCLALGIVLASVEGCGGKIDGTAIAGVAREDGGGAASAPPDEPSPGAGGADVSGKPLMGNACATVCEWNGRCGAASPDCGITCETEIGAGSPCAAEAKPYIECYASRIIGCGELPPACEPAYCAYKICAGGIVPSYCPPKT